MNNADVILLLVLLISVVIGLIRGLVVEVMSIIVWIASTACALFFGAEVGQLFEHSIQLPSLRQAAGYGLVFFGCLLIGAMLTFLLRKLVKSTGLSGTDRLLGMIFGAARGLLLIMAMIVLAGFTPLPKDSWWKESKTIPFFQHLTEILTPYFPEAMRRYLNFDQQTEPLMMPNSNSNN